MAHAASPSIVGPAQSQSCQRRDDIERRRREHHPAHFVDMSSDEIERLHEPGRKRAVSLRAQPDPTVAGRAFGLGELRRKATRRVRADTGPKSNLLW